VVIAWAVTHYTEVMQLSVARLCLDCHEVHEDERCPQCTSEAFAFMSRWIKLDKPPTRRPTRPPIDQSTIEKLDTYKQILNPPPPSSRTKRWLRNGSLLIIAGAMARWGWQMAQREANGSADNDMPNNG